MTSYALPHFRTLTLSAIADRKSRKITDNGTEIPTVFDMLSTRLLFVASSRLKFSTNVFKVLFEVVISVSNA